MCHDALRLVFTKVGVVVKNYCLKSSLHVQLNIRAAKYQLKETELCVTVKLVLCLCLPMCPNDVNDCSHRGTGLCECCASQLIFVL